MRGNQYMRRIGNGIPMFPFAELLEATPLHPLLHQRIVHQFAINRYLYGLCDRVGDFQCVTHTKTDAHG